MKAWKIFSLWWMFAAGLGLGCMTSGTPLPAQTPVPSPSSSTPSRSDGFPIVIDRGDLRIGTTVQFNRLPTASELHDVAGLPSLAHVVLALPEWPPDIGPMEALNQVPLETDVMVILPGYPPNRGASERWNYVAARLRIVIVAQGAPASHSVVADLNAMRHLERVIAEMDEPSRAGFERLQRPLSFRKLVD